MVQIVGKYQFVSSENFEDFIKNLDKELANAFLHTTPIVEVQQNDDQWVIAVFDQDKLFGTTNSFTLGEVYDEQLLAKGLTFKVGSILSRENVYRLNYIERKTYATSKDL